MPDYGLKSSVLIRMIIVLFLSLILLIPIVKVESLVEERAQRRTEAIVEVSKKWASAQTIVGPILTVPMKRVLRDRDGKPYDEIRNLNILPDSLAYACELGTQVRYRGIYQIVLYTLKLKSRGTFGYSIFNTEEWRLSTPMWQDAFVTLGITDLRGIKNNIVLEWNSIPLEAHSGVKSHDVVTSGITFRPPPTSLTLSSLFAFQMDLNGSSDLSLAPIGRRTEVSVHSEWPSPSFNGAFLPDTRTISPEGFSANWVVLELNRNFPQAWVGDGYDPSASKFGVTLLETVDQYQKTLRTTKYAIMFIVLTFMALFLSEVLAAELLHPIHYTLVGLALILFYLLLLALSEQLGFSLAYLVSSLAVLILVTLYAYALISKRQVATLVGSLILVLYVFLYVLLQLEDYALMIGSILLLIVLALTMYLTRKVNWYSLKQQ